MKNNKSLEQILKSSFDTTSLKPAKEPSEKENNCSQKLNAISQKFVYYDGKKNVGKNKLQRLSSEIQDTVDFVLSAYESEDMPSSLLNKLISVSNLRFRYYEIINEKNKEETLNQIKKIRKDYGESLATLNKQVDNIWGNVLSVILSFSVVLAMISAIDKIDKEWILVFCFFIIWIGMTLIVFFSNLFENKGMGATTSKVMYTIVLVLLVSSFVVTANLLPESDSNKIDKKDKDGNVETSNIIEKEESEIQFVNPNNF